MTMIEIFLFEEGKGKGKRKCFESNQSTLRSNQMISCVLIDNSNKIESNQ